MNVSGLLDTFNLSDSLEFMKELDDGCVDLIVTSPPYNMSRKRNDKKKGWKGAAWDKLGKGYSNSSDDMPHAEYVSWQRDCLSEMYRLINEKGAIFYNHKWRIQEGILDTRQEILEGFPVRQIIIWSRGSGLNFNDTYFVPTFEVIYMIAKKDFTLKKCANGKGDVWNFCFEKNNVHPAPFPLELPKRVIESTDAQIILDPFMGSGTTALAAKILGRNFIGIDNSQEYINIAKRRLQNACITSLEDFLK